jgi:hypothetical protein
LMVPRPSVNHTRLSRDVAVPTAVFALLLQCGFLPGLPGARRGFSGLVYPSRSIPFGILHVLLWTNLILFLDSEMQAATANFRNPRLRQSSDIPNIAHCALTHDA